MDVILFYSSGKHRLLSLYTSRGSATTISYIELKIMAGLCNLYIPPIIIDKYAFRQMKDIRCICVMLIFVA